MALLGSASFWPTLLCLILGPLTAFRSRLLSNALAAVVDHTIDDVVDFDRKRRLLETTTTGCHRLLCQMSRFCCLFPLALPLSQTVSLFFSALQVLLILASQRIESVLYNWFGTSIPEWVSNDVTTKRGAPPTMIEWLILSWVCGNYIHFLWSLCF